MLRAAYRVGDDQALVFEGEGFAKGDRVVLEHDLIHAPLDRVPLLDRHCLWVGEVEAQLVGPHL